MIPFTLKMLYGMVIDTKVLGRRKNILVFFGVVSTIAQLIVGMKWADSEVSVIIAVSIMNFAIAWLDATIDSIVVEQARCHTKGQ